MSTFYISKIRSPFCFKLFVLFKNYILAFKIVSLLFYMSFIPRYLICTWPKASSNVYSFSNLSLPYYYLICFEQVMKSSSMQIWFDLWICYVCIEFKKSYVFSLIVLSYNFAFNPCLESFSFWWKNYCSWNFLSNA